MSRDSGKMRQKRQKTPFGRFGRFCRSPALSGGRSGGQILRKCPRGTLDIRETTRGADGGFGASGMGRNKGKQAFQPVFHCF